MQENNNQQNQGNMNKGMWCSNGMCGNCGGHHMGFHVLRWVLGFLIIWMIFSFGVKIGEFKTEIENGGMYQYRMMRYNGYQPNMMDTTGTNTVLQ